MKWVEVEWDQGNQYILDRNLTTKLKGRLAEGERDGDEVENRDGRLSLIYLCLCNNWQ